MTLRDHLDEIIEMRLKGNTLQEIADTFGSTRQRVNQILGNTGRDMRSTQTKSAMGLANADMTRADLAQAAGVKPATATKAFRLLNMRHKLQGGPARIGADAEEKVCKILSGLGFDCILQMSSAPFDILINQCVKVDVKSASKKTGAPSVKSNNPVYNFRTSNGEAADFFAFFITPTNDLFIVPRHQINSPKVRFTWPTDRPEIGKIQKYHNRYDLIWKLIAEQKLERSLEIDGNAEIVYDE